MSNTLDTIVTLSQVCIPQVNAGRLNGTRSMSRQVANAKGENRWVDNDKKVQILFKGIVTKGDLIHSRDVDPIKVVLIPDSIVLMDKVIQPDYLRVPGEEKKDDIIYDVTAEKLAAIMAQHSANGHIYKVVSGHTRLETLLKYMAWKGVYEDVPLYAEVITADEETALMSNLRYVSIDVETWDKTRMAYQEVFHRGATERALHQPTVDGRCGIFTSKGDASGSYAACLIAKKKGWSFETLKEKMDASGHMPNQVFRGALGTVLNLGNTNLLKALENTSTLEAAVTFIETKVVKSVPAKKPIIETKRPEGSASDILLTAFNQAVAHKDTSELWKILDALDKLVKRDKLEKAA